MGTDIIDTSRLEDWPQRLDSYLALDHKFCWQKNNCVLFAAGAIEAMTGVNLSKQYLEGMKISRQNTIQKRQFAINRMKRVAGTFDVEELATKKLGPPIDDFAAERIRRGDIASIETQDGMALGVCAGYVVAVLSPAGIVFWPTCDIKNAWRIW